MTQPSVYFTLEAPFVSILGLFSNALEGPGVLSSQRTKSRPAQALPPHRRADGVPAKELKRLKPLREWNGTSVLIAVHHPPFSFDATHGGSPDMLADLDAGV